MVDTQLPRLRNILHVKPCLINRSTCSPPWMLPTPDLPNCYIVLIPGQQITFVITGRNNDAPMMKLSPRQPQHLPQNQVTPTSPFATNLFREPLCHCGHSPTTAALMCSLPAFPPLPVWRRLIPPVHKPSHMWLSNSPNIVTVLEYEAECTIKIE